MKKTLLAVLVPLVALSGAANAAFITKTVINWICTVKSMFVIYSATMTTMVTARTVMTPVSVSVSKVKPRSLIN